MKNAIPKSKLVFFLSMFQVLLMLDTANSAICYHQSHHFQQSYACKQTRLESDSAHQYPRGIDSNR